MERYPLPADEAAVRRYVEELWLPYHRELEATVDRHALADDVALADLEVAFRLERLEAGDHEVWVAVDDGPSALVSGGSTTDAAESTETTPFLEGDLAGFVTTEREESPVVFDRPDGLVICDLYVRESYRGTGLARDLVEHAAARARAEGCGELRLDVDVDNERALAFYEKVGFRSSRARLCVDVDAI